MTAKGGAAPTAKVTPQEYSDAVDAAELASVRLIKAEFDALPEAFARDQSSWKRSYGCEAQDVAFDKTRTRLTGAVVAEAFCRVGRKRVISIKCRYLVDYMIVGAPTDEAAESFFKRVGAFSVYPYFRAHFAEVTSQAGLMLGPLPIMKEAPRKIPPAAAS